MAPTITTLRAPNPGPFTGTGTNSYLIGAAELLVVDPGPALPAHLQALLVAIAGRPVAAILVTHAHLDHSALAPELAALTGAEVLAFGGADEGMSPAMQALAAQGLEGGEGVDAAFSPDRRLTDGAVLPIEGFPARILHTPGHMAGHLSLALDDVLLSGDHVMGWSTSIVSPPEGDMAAYMASLRRLAGERWRRFLPGHGDPVEDPAARLAQLIAHRQGREAAILAALLPGPLRPDEIAAQVYQGLAPGLLPAAARNVLAHLIDLGQRGLVHPGPGPLAHAVFARV